MHFKNPTDEEIKEILTSKKRIAVVGLSDNPMKTSYMVSAVMQDAGFEIIPVNPSADEVLGVKAVKTLQDIDGHVDIVNVFRRSEYLPEVAKDAVAIGADVFWAQLGLANDEAYDYLKAHDTVSIMDKCIKVEYARLVR
ncbi:CoA-binding protein [Fictibacillus terranigra]|uniref:CoA-binding protein n=1 Tax=Fictibacillus terranigra TaxID=3058424 RepID=A0ABT8E9C1_9BACL|nr:CoA-binding protein [Fictibacillus sp. CENA-BCM004]MDN4074482.1 CoA-binding protein [Fictibacillus sp. CENA-BCM004]